MAAGATGLLNFRASQRRSELIGSLRESKYPGGGGVPEATRIFILGKESYGA